METSSPLPAMKPGEFYPQFDYVDDRGRKLRAYLTKAHFPSTTIAVIESGTDDPRWYVIHPEKGDVQEGPFDYLTYVGEDRQHYTVQVHAEYDRGAKDIEIWLEHHLASGGGNYDKRTNFTIRNWDDQPVHLEIFNRVLNDTAPKFQLFNA